MFHTVPTDLMALFIIGIPLLILEISLGQYYQVSQQR